MEKIGGRAAHRGHAKVLQEHDLAIGVAARGRNHGSAQALGAVVRTQATGEEAVAVGDLNHVSAMQAASCQAANNRRGPHVHVFLRVGDNDGFSCSPAGGVEADHVLHGAGEEAEGIGIAQVALLRERKFGDVGERTNAGGSEAAFVHALAEELDVTPGAVDDGLEARELESAQLFHRSVVRRRGRMAVGGAGFKLRDHCVCPYRERPEQPPHRRSKETAHFAMEGHSSENPKIVAFS